MKRRRHTPEQIIRKLRMKADDAKRLKELERENATLKRIAAEKELEVVALKEIAKGNW
jgi:putative transposase